MSKVEIDPEAKEAERDPERIVQATKRPAKFSPEESPAKTQGGRA